MQNKAEYAVDFIVSTKVVQPASVMPLAVVEHRYDTAWFYHEKKNTCFFFIATIRLLQYRGHLKL